MSGRVECDDLNIWFEREGKGEERKARGKQLRVEVNVHNHMITKKMRFI